MINPSWSFADVFALNALQKSMIFTPCCPRAGPTGGAGVALPAGICNFTWPITFFAINFASGLRFLYLQEVQFNRRGPAEDSHHYFQCVPVRINLINDSRKARERPVDNFDCFTFFERQFRLWLIGRSRNTINNLLNFFFTERRWSLPRAHETCNSWSTLHQMPCLVARATLVCGLHLHEHVAGVKHFLRNDSLAASNFYNLFRRNEHIVDLIFEVERLHPTP